MCILHAKVAPVLNETFGEPNWKVDIKDHKKILTASIPDAERNEVIQIIEKAGYKAEVLNWSGTTLSTINQINHG